MSMGKYSFFFVGTLIFFLGACSPKDRVVACFGDKQCEAGESCVNGSCKVLACGGDADCSGHGQCNDSSGDAVCTCDEGYAGADCAHCDSGYQDKDANGSCEKSCALAGLDCSGHGQCSDTSGLAHCLCDEGFDGADCSGCAAGYHPDGQAGCEPDTSCLPNSCNNHGTCDDSDGQVVCNCGQEYAGSNCEECAAGFQDKDGDGTCFADCESSDLDCSDHGHCSDSGGRAICICDDEYTGESCKDCAFGFQDKDGDGSCKPTCEHAQLDCGEHGLCDDTSGSAQCLCDEGFDGIDCSGCAAGYHPDGQGGCVLDQSCQPGSCNYHGACEDSTGEVVCTCDDEYIGNNCDECVSGYQDNDQDGTCLPACATMALDCSNHGSCSDSGGVAVCVCEDGYAGQHCAACADGYQDNNQNGTCLPTCTTMALDCSNHGSCSDSDGVAVCVCEDGYAGQHCAACANGYQDNDQDGTCRPSCTNVVMDCSGHGHCSDISGYAVCMCDDGFAGVDCSQCDPSFQYARCDGSVVQNCVGGTWQDETDCAVDGQVCVDGACASGDLCPDGQSCDIISGQLRACLDGGEIPANNQTGCGQSNPCSGNFSCFCADQDCSNTVCLENCGTCPDSLVCTDITNGDGSGVFGCLEGDGSIPSDAQFGCGGNETCNGNAACWCLNSNCSDTVCLANCSTQH